MSIPETSGQFGHDEDDDDNEGDGDYDDDDDDDDYAVASDEDSSDEYASESDEGKPSNFNNFHCWWNHSHCFKPGNCLRYYQFYIILYYIELYWHVSTKADKWVKKKRLIIKKRKNEIKIRDSRHLFHLPFNDIQK